MVTAVGGVDTEAACPYGAERILDSTCPITCKVLLMNTWGDCYCLNPTYVPYQLGWTDRMVRNVGVKGVYAIVAKKTDHLFFTCGSWLREPDNMAMWNCTDFNKK